MRNVAHDVDMSNAATPADTAFTVGNTYATAALEADAATPHLTPMVGRDDLPSSGSAEGTHEAPTTDGAAALRLVVELSDKLIVAWRDVKVWRAVTVALTAELADHGTYVPSSPAVLAYSHARNGRMAEALEVLA